MKEKKSIDRKKLYSSIEVSKDLLASPLRKGKSMEERIPFYSKNNKDELGI